MISLYLLYFYTNVMHLNAGAVSIMFLVTKFIDGVSDLIVGYLIDKTNTRWGKSRPWILCKFNNRNAGGHSLIAASRIDHYRKLAAIHSGI